MRSGGSMLSILSITLRRGAFGGECVGEVEGETTDAGSWGLGWRGESRDCACGIDHWSERTGRGAFASERVDHLTRAWSGLFSKSLDCVSTAVDRECVEEVEGEATEARDASTSESWGLGWRGESWDCVCGIDHWSERSGRGAFTLDRAAHLTRAWSDLLSKSLDCVSTTGGSAVSDGHRARAGILSAGFGTFGTGPAANFGDKDAGGGSGGLSAGVDRAHLLFGDSLTAQFCVGAVSVVEAGHRLSEDESGVVGWSGTGLYVLGPAWGGGSFKVLGLGAHLLRAKAAVRSACV